MFANTSDNGKRIALTPAYFLLNTVGVVKTSLGRLWADPSGTADGTRKTPPHSTLALV